MFLPIVRAFLVVAMHLWLLPLRFLCPMASRGGRIECGF